MNRENVMLTKNIENKNKEILLEIALILNKELFDEFKISYKLFKFTEKSLLKEIKKYKLNTTNSN